MLGGPCPCASSEPPFEGGILPSLALLNSSTFGLLGAVADLKFGHYTGRNCGLVTVGCRLPAVHCWLVAVDCLTLTSFDSAISAYRTVPYSPRTVRLVALSPVPSVTYKLYCRNRGRGVLYSDGLNELGGAGSKPRSLHSFLRGSEFQLRHKTLATIRL